ncbi:MAG: peptidoglycan-associated lipoprotein Pal [Novosphingobium sp.]|nr:peptidoglycan-associated lipoprotein Pal [Novosphingobium sp.]MCP5403430.1 peptidoglycan-associated lipoprotein Pal [Novosphingobium sp.]
MRGIYALTLLTIYVIGLSACSTKAPPADIASMAPPGVSQTHRSGDYDADGNYIGPGSQADLLRNAGSDRVFFDLDSSALDGDDRETLRRQAAWLVQNLTVEVTIEGHCDERGTREYNLGLGERRANAAKNFLVASGVSPARMSVVSYGKERPQEIGSDEKSWALNRRAVTLVVRRM